MGVFSEHLLDNLDQDPKERLIARLALYGTIQALSGQLLTSRSATLTLENWFKKSHSSTTSIIAIQEVSAKKTPSEGTLERLGASVDQVSYRKVALCLGGVVLSTAENWYVPAHMTQSMNRELQTTTVPFGKVVSTLKPFRAPLDAEILQKDILPADWYLRPQEDLLYWTSMQSPLTYEPDRDLFVHHALLFSEHGLSLAEVHETYKMRLLTSQTTAGLS